MSDVGASIKCSDDDWKERVYAELKLADLAVFYWLECLLSGRELTSPSARSVSSMLSLVPATESFPSIQRLTRCYPILRKTPHPHCSFQAIAGRGRGYGI
jgi:hypothetical protein